MRTEKLSILLLGLLSGPVWAGMTFVGVESGAPPNFAAQRWSLAAEKKNFAVTNNIYGSSGYYCLAPGTDVPVKPVAGGDITAYGTMVRKPEFLAAHPAPVAGNWVNFAGYAIVTKPEAAGPDQAFRIGGISAPVGAVINGAGVETKFVDAFSFKLAADAKFRLGIMVDAFAAGGAYAPDYISVYEDGEKKTVYSPTALTRDATPDLVTFDIEGKAGTLYIVGLHRKTPADGAVVGFSLITFDKLAETAAPKAP